MQIEGKRVHSIVQSRQRKSEEEREREKKRERKRQIDRGTFAIRGSLMHGAVHLANVPIVVPERKSA